MQNQPGVDPSTGAMFRAWIEDATDRVRTRTLKRVIAFHILITFEVYRSGPTYSAWAEDYPGWPYQRDFIHHLTPAHYREMREHAAPLLLPPDRVDTLFGIEAETTMYDYIRTVQEFYR